MKPSRPARKISPNGKQGGGFWSTGTHQSQGMPQQVRICIALASCHSKQGQAAGHSASLMDPIKPNCCINKAASSSCSSLAKEGVLAVCLQQVDDLARSIDHVHAPLCLRRCPAPSRARHCRK